MVIWLKAKDDKANHQLYVDILLRSVLLVVIILLCLAVLFFLVSSFVVCLCSLVYNSWLILSCQIL